MIAGAGAGAGGLGLEPSNSLARAGLAAAEDFTRIPFVLWWALRKASSSSCIAPGRLRSLMIRATARFLAVPL